METIFAELLSQQKCAEDSEPHTPAKHLRNLLHVHHPKDKDELVEDKVPELVPHVLVLEVLELAEDDGVDEPDQQEEAAAGHVQDGLQDSERRCDYPLKPRPANMMFGFRPYKKNPSFTATVEPLKKNPPRKGQLPKKGHYSGPISYSSSSL